MSKSGLPVKVNGTDVAKPVRQWWMERSPDKIREATGILDAARDVGLVALAELMRQLRSKKTDDRVKREIALAMAMRPPKLIVPLAPPGRESGDAATELLGSYGVE